MQWKFNPYDSTYYQYKHSWYWQTSHHGQETAGRKVATVQWQRTASSHDRKDGNSNLVCSPARNTIHTTGLKIIYHKSLY